MLFCSFENWMRVVLTKPHFDLQVKQLIKSLNKQILNPIIVRLLHFFEIQ